MAGKLFLSLPRAASYQVLEEHFSGTAVFSFVSFSGKVALKLAMRPTNDEALQPHFQPDSEIPLEPDRYTYQKLIQKTIDHISQLGLGKIVISRPQALRGRLDPVVLFKKLVSAYPEACVYLFSHPQCGTWAGATPETLLKKEGETVSTMSLAGTRTVGNENTFATKEELEQQLVTDYISGIFRTDKGLRDVQVSSPRLSRAGNLVHFKTPISASASKSFDAGSLLAKLHPTPAVAGFPKKEALRFIGAHEAYDRQFYAGYFGLEETGGFQYFVNLRCMQIFKEAAVLYAGGGITAHSNPEAEWEETEAKMQTLLSVLKTE